MARTRRVTGRDMLAGTSLEVKNNFQESVRKGVTERHIDNSLMPDERTDSFGHVIAVKGTYALISDHGVYVGSSKDVHRRLSEHEKCLKNGEYGRKPIQAAWDSPGRWLCVLLSESIADEMKWIGRVGTFNIKGRHDDIDVETAKRVALDAGRGAQWTDEELRRLDYRLDQGCIEGIVYPDSLNGMTNRTGHRWMNTAYGIVQPHRHADVGETCGRVSEFVAMPNEVYSEGRGLPVCDRCVRFYHDPKPIHVSKLLNEATWSRIQREEL